MLCLDFFADVRAFLEFVVKVFDLLRSVNCLAARYALEQGFLEFAAMDDAPEFVVLGNLAECAAIAEYDDRNEVRLLAADF